MSNKSQEVTLFLIEDDDIDAMTIEQEFKKQRISNPIIRAQDGMEALELLNENKIPKPFAILLDLQIPRMNGAEFLTELRQNQGYRDSVVFVLTTSEDEQDIMQSYQLNVAGYFVKDETGKAFLSIIDLLDGYWKVVYLPMELS